MVEPEGPELMRKPVERALAREADTRPGRFWPAVGRLAAFVALLAAAAWGFDRLVTSGLRRIQTSKFGSFNHVVDGLANAEILVNGSSRALTQYDPRILHEVTGLSAYTLGINGVQTDVQCAVLKTYLRRNSKPRLVIQNLEAFTFEATRPGNIYDPGFFLPYLGEQDLYEGLLQIDPAVWKWRHIPLYGYVVEDMRFTWVEGLIGHLRPTGRDDYFLGFNPRHIPWTGDFERFRASVPNGIAYKIEPRGVQALEEILATCREQQIPVLLVYSPEYREMQDLETNRAEIFSLFRDLAKRYGAELWDYSDSPICAARDNFYNSQHLNAQGADLFSRDLAHRLADSGFASRPTPRDSESAKPVRETPTTVVKNR